jgi:hypothetical protein
VHHHDGGNPPARWYRRLKYVPGQRGLSIRAAKLHPHRRDRTPSLRDEHLGCRDERGNHHQYGRRQSITLDHIQHFFTKYPYRSFVADDRPAVRSSAFVAIVTAILRFGSSFGDGSESPCLADSIRPAADSDGDCRGAPISNRRTVHHPLHRERGAMGRLPHRRTVDVASRVRVPPCFLRGGAGPIREAFLLRSRL